MKDISLVASEYFEIKKQLEELELKRKKLREELLNFLNSSNTTEIIVVPYRIKYLELAFYEYDINTIQKQLQPKNLFLDVIRVSPRDYKQLLISDKLSDHDVESLLKARTAISTVKSLYVQREQ